MTSDELSVLRANDAFYEAFAAHDAGRMDEVWARDRPVSCVHPGWALIDGRAAVMESWRAILDSDPIHIECSAAQVYVAGDAAYVVCCEGLPEEPPRLIATNIFGREEGEWKLVHHHAGHLPTHRAASPSGPTN